MNQGQRHADDAKAVKHGNGIEETIRVGQIKHGQQLGGCWPAGWLWVSSTPLGVPSEPLVKRTTAVSEPWVRGQAARIQSDAQEGEPLPPARHSGANVLQINEFNARIRHRLHV